MNKHLVSRLDKLVCLLVLALLLASPAWAVAPHAVDVPGLPIIKHFQVKDYSEDYQPAGHCDQRVAALVDTAEHEVHVQAYQFQSTVVQNALIRAAKRGVKVWLLLDKTQKPNSVKRAAKCDVLRAKGKGMDKHPNACDPDDINAAGLLAAGVVIKIDRQPPIAHNKRLILDGLAVVGGSFNFSPHALKNAENCDFAISADLAEQVLAEFMERWNLPGTKEW